MSAWNNEQCKVWGYWSPPFGNAGFKHHSILCIKQTASTELAAASSKKRRKLHVAEWIVILLALVPPAPIRNTCRHTKGQEGNELAIKKVTPLGPRGPRNSNISGAFSLHCEIPGKLLLLFHSLIKLRWGFPIVLIYYERCKISWNNVVSKWAWEKKTKKGT